MSAADPPRLIVTAAVVEDNGRLLVARRLPGVHLEGYWEFPGGKCQAGETLAACLRREVAEELDCEAEVLDELLAVSHTYPDRIVELHFFAVRLLGPPRAALGQELRWILKHDLDRLRFPPADDELIALLRGAARTEG